MKRLEKRYNDAWVAGETQSSYLGWLEIELNQRENQCMLGRKEEERLRARIATLEEMLEPEDFLNQEELA